MRLQKSSNQGSLKSLFHLIQEQPISFHLVDSGLEKEYNKLKIKYKRLKFLSMLEAAMLVVVGISLIVF